tara:strand:- start:19726 stop:22536 length:2811 start_codon:yes stop_codon:yes gene_type:complete
MDKKELLSVLNLSSFVSLDFETTGLNSEEDRIIEVAALRFKDGEIHERFTTLVNPMKHISTMITNITGITNDMVKEKPVEKDIIKDLLSFLKNDPLVAHNIQFDIRFLNSLCKRNNSLEVKNSTYDTLQLARTVCFDQPVFNLSSLSELFGLSTEGTHRAEKDTENCGLIFIKLIEIISDQSLEIISKIQSFIKDSELPNSKLYDDLAKQLSISGSMEYKGKATQYAYNLKSNRFKYKGSNKGKELSAENIFGPNGLLKNELENFEYRKNQVSYAEDSEKVLNGESGISLIEAGTGLGKTMAYLFGAFKKSIDNKEDGPTIISCNTKHLQDQLFYKDLPHLARGMNIPIDAMMVKGRKNYLCKTRFDWVVSDPSIIEKNDLEALIPVMFWLFHTKTGDVSECSGFFNSRRTWLLSSFCSESGFCTSGICDSSKGCYYGPLRQALYKASTIIVNHSLLMTEIEGPGFFPEFNSVIIDEAHNLVKSAYEQFKIEWTEKGVLMQLQNIDPSHPRSLRWNQIIEKISEKHPSLHKHRDRLKSIVSNGMKSLSNLMRALAEENAHSFQMGKEYQEKPIVRNIVKLYAPVNGELIIFKNNLQDLMIVLTEIRAIILELDSTQDKYPTIHPIMGRNIDIVTKIKQSLMILTEKQEHDWVYWLEGNYKPRDISKDQLEIALCASIIDIGKVFGNKFFKNLKHCLLTSATLKINGSFDYFLSRMGLLDKVDVKTADYISPFHYGQQVRYHQYAGNADPSKNPKYIGDLVYFLHHKFGKRMMVLFTSRKLLSDTTDYIKSMQQGKNLPLFAQIKGASRPGIINGMHRYSNGILFGTNSFWEGVDLPGDLLEILILVKLPFDVPTDPLIKSYSEYIYRNGGNSFIEFTVPECVIKFRQGFGRLIRSTSDEGRFICLDNRIITKRYGGAFVKSLPMEMEPFSEFDSIN